ncbi:CLUMA_CG007867, isoform A [Clunio marinus]|uniref:CLUMA_CG007867, isoform A n=1 Tax=Clunio marinus TaxID=568069 RepID=A0A1J1I7G2_9DIPT|nr:CLUMA_CG007867, isoform A [Clunio marinus]
MNESKNISKLDCVSKYDQRSFSESNGKTVLKSLLVINIQKATSGNICTCPFHPPLILVVLIAIQGTYAIICARDLRTGQYQNFNSLEDMYASNAIGGRYAYVQDGHC